MSTNFKGSTRRLRLPSNWNSLRTKVLRRDNYRCQYPDCSLTARDIDHIEPNDNHNLSNLQSLCSYHHKLKTSLEGNTARWKKEREMKDKYLRPKETRFLE